MRSAEFYERAGDSSAGVPDFPVILDASRLRIGKIATA